MGKKDFRMYANLIYLSQIAIMMVVPIFMGVFIGRFLDEKLNTGNIMLLIFIFLGVGGAFMNLYKFAMSKSKEDKDKNKRK